MNAPLMLQKCRKYVNVEDREINVSQILSDAEATWSNEEIIMPMWPRALYSSQIAIASISIHKPLANLPTCTVLRAGGSRGKNSL